MKASAAISFRPTEDHHVYSEPAADFAWASFPGPVFKHMSIDLGAVNGTVKD